MRRELPILFTGEMVRATLEGRKTQTRRVITEKDCWQNGLSKKFHRVSLEDAFPVDTKEYLRVPYCHKEDYSDVIDWGDEGVWRIDSKYQVGDHVYIRESFRVEGVSKIYPNLGKVSVIYKNDNKQRFIKLTDDVFDKFNKWKEPYKTKSGLFMFKSLARIWLEVTDVRVERVRDITEQDAEREGCCKSNMPLCGGVLPYHDSARYEFEKLWDSINAKRGFGWEKNPWVWAYSFKRINK